MTAASELDRVVLGVVAKFGPLTPYAVRRHFASSPVPAYSSGTGTIYPVIARLERAGLVRTRADRRGRQARKQVVASAAGRRALVTWLEGELAPADYRAPRDPLRTQLYFVGLLTPARRRRWLDRALRRLREERATQAAYVESFPARGVTRLSRLAAEGLLELTDARLAWLERARRQLLRVRP